MHCRVDIFVGANFHNIRGDIYHLQKINPRIRIIASEESFLVCSMAQIFAIYIYI